MADTPLMERLRLGRTLTGAVALLVVITAVTNGVVTLITYARYVTGLGSFTSRFAWRSLGAGLLEVAIACAMVWFAVRCFSAKPLPSLRSISTR